jgi:hypothetical protein
MRHFEKQNACQTKLFVFGNTALFVRDRICLIMCPSKYTTKIMSMLYAFEASWYWKGFPSHKYVYMYSINKRPMMKW